MKQISVQFESLVSPADAEQIGHALELLGVDGTLPDKHKNSPLGGIVHVLSNLQELMTAVIQLAGNGDPSSTDKFRSMGEALGRLRQANPFNSSLPRAWLALPKPGAAYPQRGTLESHPLLAAIWRMEASHTFDEGLRLLAASLVLARKIRPNELPALYKAALSLRQIVVESGTATNGLPTSAQDLDGYLQALTASQNSRLVDVISYLKLALKKRKKWLRQTEASGENVPDDVDTDLAASGATPLDTYGRADFVLINPDDEEPSRPVTPAEARSRPPHAERTQVKRAATAVARANQGLAGLPSDLTEREMKALLRALTRQTVDERRDWTDVEAAILACWLTGRPLGEVAGYPVLDCATAPMTQRAVENRVKRAGGALLIGDHGDAWWALSPGRPEVSGRRTPTAVELANVLFLPVPRWFSGRLSYASGKPIAGAIDLPARAVEILGSLERQYDLPKRWTPTRIRGWLALTIQRLGFGSVAASIITGEVTAASRAPLHYERWEKQDLQNAYQQAITTLYTSDFAEPWAQVDPHPPVGEISAKHYGSAFAPQINDFKIGIERIRKDLIELRSKSNRRSGMAEFHNVYTVYTALMFGVAAGMRAVNDFLPSRDTIDPRLGTALIRDKNIEDGYNARVVPLPDMAIRQIIEWHDHAFRVSFLTACSGPAGATWLAARRVQLGTSIPPYFVSDKGEIVEASIGQVQAMSQRLGLGFAANAGRHLVATWLKDRLPSEYVRAFLGHWVRGAEPFSVHACLDPLEYYRSVRTETSALLDELGFAFEPCEA